MKSNSQRPGNPLALAVLVLLFERSMHPNEMAPTLKERKKEASIKLNYGLLYTVIEQLQAKQLIVARETLRDGRRPEKTIYQLTPAGGRELVDWMRELVSEPVKEFPRFEAALSLIPVLPPEEAAQLLEIRVALLEKTLEEIDESARVCREMKLPRLFSLENEFHRALTKAEWAFVKGLLADIRGDAGGLASEWTRLRISVAGAKAGRVSGEAPGKIKTKTKPKNKIMSEQTQTAGKYCVENDPEMVKYWMMRGPKTAAFLLVIPGCALMGYGVGLLAANAVPYLVIGLGAGLLIWGLTVALGK